MNRKAGRITAARCIACANGGLRTDKRMLQACCRRNDHGKARDEGATPRSRLRGKRRENMMKRRAFGMLLSLCLVLALIPAAAFAEDAAEMIPLTAPYTTIVKMDGSIEPGETVFTLKLMNARGEVLRNAEVTGTSVITNGVNDYKGELTIAGTIKDLEKLFSPYIFVQQVDEGKDGWEYDDKVWCLVWNNGPVAYSLDDAAPEEVPNGLLIYPTIYTKDDDGGYYNLDEDKDPVNKMTFVNTYTKVDTKANDDVSALPKTGDSSNLTGWLILLAVSAAAVAGAVVYSRRRKNARE